MIDSVIDSNQRNRLTRMKLLATGLLVAMAIVFLITRSLEGSIGWLGFLRAFAEAAMIGALADWFAVTALFRYPLGVPIPHTAIIPRQKDRIGESLARFVKEHFLITDALRPKLETLDFAGRMGSWIRQSDNAKRLTGDAGAFTTWFLDSLDNTELRHFLRENLNLTLREIRIAPFLGRVLDLITAGNHHQELVDVLVRTARSQLAVNKVQLRVKIKEESPWWIPKFVDQEIYDKIVTEIEELLGNVGADSEHAARKKFNEGVTRFIDRMRNDPEVIERGEAIKEQILDNPSVQKYFFEVWTYLSEYLSREAEDPDSRIRKRIEYGIVKFGESLEQSEPIREQINLWLTDATLHVVSNYREEIADIITETVRRWDPDATSERVELAVGRDLQFIRINGTLVGGLVGLGIYTVTHVFL